MTIGIRRLVLGLVAWACLACGAAAQNVYDLEADILSDVLVVFPTKGPAWWKATKDESTVWIFALPPAVVPTNLNWNQNLFVRRVRGSRAMIMAPSIDTYVDGTFEDPLPMTLAARIDKARLAERQTSEYRRPATMRSIFTLKNLHFRRGMLGFPMRKQVVGMADSTRTPVITPPKLEYVRWVEDFPLDNPDVLACAERLMDEVETPVAKYRAAGRAWAEGRIAQALEAPSETSLSCGTPMQAALSRRAIDWQTKEIAKALEVPGKVIAVVNMRQLLAREGILQRLRDQGYTIADPRKALRD